LVTCQEQRGASVILSEAKEAMCGHGLLRFAQDDTNGSGRAAGAVEAAVIETGPATPGELPSQRLTGAVQPDAGVARRNSRLLGEPADAQAVEIHAA
jgi:hypothetical protein